MLDNSTKKTKVNLSDYNYQRDIQNRLLMSAFTIEEVEIFEELLHSSLSFTVMELASDLDTDIRAVLAFLDKMQATGLVKLDNDKVTVDKELRKYFEFQLTKFDDDFKPGIEFLQNLLRKVPIQALPAWYLIPRSSDNIFQSIIDKFMLTPQLYQRYLNELNFDDPVLEGIMHDVHSTPTHKVRSRMLREKYGLTREAFEEYMLLLEFNLVCCLSYNRIEDENGWKEVVMPFYEWTEYLKFRQSTIPTMLRPDAVVSKRDLEFGFALDARVILNAIQKQPLELETRDAALLRQVPKLASVKSIMKDCENTATVTDSAAKNFQSYLGYVISKLCAMNIAANDNGKLVTTDSSSIWAAMSNEDFCMYIYRNQTNKIYCSDVSPDLCTLKNFREIENGLKSIPSNEWILFEDFMRGLTVSIGETEAVKIQKKGRSWQYVIPSYTEEEKKFVKVAVMERLFEAGITEPGTFEDKDCFRITPFGYSILGNI